MAPVGLGMLAAGGYAADLRAFYCPTGAVLDYGATGPFRGSPSFPGRMAANLDAGVASNFLTCDPADLQKMGGPAPSSLIYGDYRNVMSTGARWLGSGGYYPNNYARKQLAGSYAYRGQPIAINADGNDRWSNGSSGAYADTAGSRNFGSVVNFKDMPEGVNTVWKTQRLLGLRATVMDRFGKRVAKRGELLAGDALWAHREGYNILYGDGGVRWMGDPQQRLIWAPVQAAGSTDNAATYAGVMGSQCNVVTPLNMNAGGSVQVSRGISWWITFDQFAGLDPGVPIVGL